MNRRPKCKRSCLNISTIPTIAEDAESLTEPPRRRRASSCSSPGPEITGFVAPTPPPTPPENQKPHQVRKRATEPDLRKHVVVCEATRVYNVYGRVYLDDAPPSPQSEDSSDTSELVGYNEQVFLVMKARRRMAARANRKARKSLQGGIPQCMERIHPKAGSTTASVTTTVNAAGDENPLTTDSGRRRVTSGTEAKCIEQQNAEKLDEVIRNIEKMSVVADIKSTAVKRASARNAAPGAGRVNIGKDLRLTADMLSAIPEDRQWGWIRRWVIMLLERLGELYDAVYEANICCSDLCYNIINAQCDVELALQLKDIEMEAEARRVVDVLKGRQGDATTRRERIRTEARDKRQRFEYYYRDLMVTLGHPELERPASSAEEGFDPHNPFKSFSYAV